MGIIKQSYISKISWYSLRICLSIYSIWSCLFPFFGVFHEIPIQLWHLANDRDDLGNLWRISRPWSWFLTLHPLFWTSSVRIKFKTRSYWNVGSSFLIYFIIVQFLQKYSKDIPVDCNPYEWKESLIPLFLYFYLNAWSNRSLTQ